MTANFESELARLAVSAGRLADLFDRVADGLEAGQGTIKVRKAAAGPMSSTELVYEPNIGEHQQLPPGVISNPDGSLINVQGENYVPQTPQEPAPAATQITGVGAPGGAPVEGLPQAPAPAGNPFTTDQAPAPAEKKGGRRTLEEIASDNGVRLEDVKAWLGEGKRATKGAIEEYARLKREHEAANPAPAVAPSTGAGQYVAETQMDYSQQAPGAPEPVVGPYDGWTPQADGQPAPVSTPPMPTQASHPFGDTSQHAVPDFGAGAVPQGQQPNPFQGQPAAAPQFSPFETQPYQQ